MDLEDPAVPRSRRPTRQRLTCHTDSGLHARLPLAKPRAVQESKSRMSMVVYMTHFVF